MIDISKLEIRAAIIKEAHEWLKTPYLHMGRVKGVGVDCACLLAEVAERAGACPHVEIDYYPRDWHHHREEERFLNVLEKFAYRIEQKQTLPGDIIMFKIGRAYAHGAIIVDAENVIHALTGRGVELANVRIDARLRPAQKLYYRAKVL